MSDELPPPRTDADAGTDEEAGIEAVRAALGRARAVIAEADGQATANRKLAESISPVLIDYQRVQKWDGKMPLYQGGQGSEASVLLPGPSTASATTQAPVAAPTPAPARAAAPAASPAPTR